MKPSNLACAAVLAFAVTGLVAIWFADPGWLAAHAPLLAEVAVLAVAVALLGWLSRRGAPGPERPPVDEQALQATQRATLAGLIAPAVAHDGNNALLAIRFHLSELERLHGDDDATRHVLRELTRTADDLVALIQRLRHATARHPRVSFSRLRLAPVVDDALALLRLHPEVRGCALANEIDPALELVGDERRLEQIVVNLVLNAGEATGGEGTVALRARSTPAAIVLEVHDDGPGVSEARRQQVLEPFVTSRPGAAGLGLWAARACARAHGGELEVDVSPLGGACVRVRLPHGLAPSPGRARQAGPHVDPVPA